MLTVVALALLCESDALHAGRVSGPKVEPWRQLIQDRRLRSRRSSLVSCSVPASSGGETLYKPLRSLLLAAGIQEELDEVTEMSAGFCNWVYKVDLPTPPHSVVVKLFSPLAELRLDPSVRGLGDQLAGEHGLGPRVLYRSREGLITTFVDGQTLEESDIHAAGSRLPRAIARRLADLHSLTPSEHKSDGRAVLWHFLDCMLEHTDQTSMPPSISLSEVRREVERMRARCEALDLPIVYGHGDLKPSNVMSTHSSAAAGAAVGAAAGAAADADAEQDQANSDSQICFIDFELAGQTYRGYDLYKLFRTTRNFSNENFRDFLETYRAALLPVDESFHSSRCSCHASLPELEAEAFAAEPLTWLEAAIFFLFALSVYPTQADVWRPLALQRWESYLSAAAIIDADGEATRALMAARNSRQEQEPASSRGG